jgi:outer membrane immunogenic protein
MRKSLQGGAALMALGLSGTLVSGAAIAGDLEIPSAVPPYKAPAPVVRLFSWEGFYIGGNAGGHWGSDKITTTTDTGWADPLAAPAGAGGAAAIDAASSITLHPTGGLGGLQVGYNLQGTSGNVFGVEVDFDWLSGTATRNLTGIAIIDPRDVMTNSVQASFLSTARLRWGTTVLSDRSLFFLTAGFSFATLKTTDSMGHFGNAVITSTSNSTTEPGWVAGFGFAYAFTDFVSARVEYLHVNVKHVDTTIPATAGNADSIAVTHNWNDDILRAGIDFKLWRP